MSRNYIVSFILLSRHYSSSHPLRIYYFLNVYINLQSKDAVTKNIQAAAASISVHLSTTSYSPSLSFAPFSPLVIISFSLSSYFHSLPFLHSNLLNSTVLNATILCHSSTSSVGASSTTLNAFHARFVNPNSLHLVSSLAPIHSAILVVCTSGREEKAERETVEERDVLFIALLYLLLFT